MIYLSVLNTNYRVSSKDLCSFENIDRDLYITLKDMKKTASLYDDEICFSDVHLEIDRPKTEYLTKIAKDDNRLYRAEFRIPFYDRNKDIDIDISLFISWYLGVYKSLLLYILKKQLNSRMVQSLNNHITWEDEGDFLKISVEFISL